MNDLLRLRLAKHVLQHGPATGKLPTGAGSEAGGSPTPGKSCAPALPATSTPATAALRT